MAAYKALAIKWHNKQQDDDGERFRAIQSAYEFLKGMRQQPPVPPSRRPRLLGTTSSAKPSRGQANRIFNGSSKEVTISKENNLTESGYEKQKRDLKLLGLSTLAEVGSMERPKPPEPAAS